MPTMSREKTKFPGVTFVWGTGADGKPEKIFYIRYRKDGRQIEEKAGRQFKDYMTPARANALRTARIQGREPSNVERREKARQEEEQREGRWTISKLWSEYKETHSGNKILHAESLKFDRYLKGPFGEKEPKELLALDVDRLRIKLQEQGKLTTAARVLEILRRTINFGVKRGLVPPLPYRIEVPKLNNETTEDLSEVQLQALLKLLDDDPDQKAAQHHAAGPLHRNAPLRDPVTEMGRCGLQPRLHQSCGPQRRERPVHPLE